MSDKDGDFFKKLSLVVGFFERAEHAIKSAETVEGKISITPINQIRYAFKHMTTAIESQSNGRVEDAEENIRLCIGHCKRAFYDACDAEITFCIGQFDEFVEGAHKKNAVLSKILKDYADNISTINRAKKFLESDQFDIEDKAERYKEAEKVLGEVKAIYNKLPGYYEVVNEQLSAEKKLQKELHDSILREEKSLRNSRLSLFVAFLAVVATISVVIFDEPLKKLGKSLIDTQQPAPEKQMPK